MVKLDILSSEPLIPCCDLKSKALLAEESKLRAAIYARVVSLATHIGTCTAHGVLSAGTTLPFHLPVVIWVAYKLKGDIKRRTALKKEAKRRGLTLLVLKKRNVAIPVAFSLLTPALTEIGGDLINDLVIEMSGPGGPSEIMDIPMPSTDAAADSVGPGSGGGGANMFDIYTATTDGMEGQSASNLAGSNILSGALELLERALMDEGGGIIGDGDGPPPGFADIINDLANESGLIDGAILGAAAGGILSSIKYQMYCDCCSKRLDTTWFSCIDCEDYDLCTDCFMSHKSGHPTAHDFKEIKMAAISRELDELRTLISSLRPENARVTKSGGGYTFCDGCQSPIGGKGDGHDTGIHYMCLECPDFDVCRNCLVNPATREAHISHTFVPVKPPVKAPPRPMVTCDCCFQAITTDMWLTCTEPDCQNNVDLHPTCRDWYGNGLHQDWHRVEYTSHDRI